MNLVAIKQHMQQVRMATLGSLCAIFNADPDRVRCLLQHWMHKGKVRQCVKKSACGTKCFKCPSLVSEMYEWVYN